MQNMDLFGLAEDLKKVRNLEGFKVAYAVARNIKKVETTIRELRGRIKRVPEYSDYTEKIKKLDNEYSKEQPSNVDLREIQKKKKEDYAKVEKEYEEAIKRKEEAEKQWAELLEQETEIEFHKIKKEDIPENITVEQMRVLLDFVTDADQV